MEMDVGAQWCMAAAVVAGGILTPRISGGGGLALVFTFVVDVVVELFPLALLPLR